MADMHLTRELLHALSRDEISSKVLASTMLEHLTNLCPFCRSELDAFVQERRTSQEGGSPLLSTEAFSAVVDRHMRDFHKGHGKARREVETLLALPRDERTATVRRSRTRFRGREVVWLLLLESRRMVTTDPEEARHVAELARLIVHYSPVREGSMDLLALATAYMANACRAGSNLTAADRHFEYARSVITHQGVTNTEILARIDHLEGSLRMDQRNFKEAEKLLTRAAMLFSLVGETVEQGRVLITLGYMYFLLGELVRAVEVTKAGLRDLPLQERHLRHCGRYNLARFLTEAGEYREAVEILREDEELHGGFPEPWTQLRLVWLHGKIAAGLGEDEAAERHFLDARAGFMEQGISYDAAMVALEDLSALYLRQGRTAEVKGLAEEMIAVFQEQNLPHDALRAVRFLAAAAQREELTVGMVRDYAAQFRHAVSHRPNGLA